MDLDDHAGFFVFVAVDIAVFTMVMFALLRAAVLDGRRSHR